MARNLVREQEIQDIEDKKEIKKPEPKKEDPVQPEKEIVYITTEQAMLNNLDVIVAGQAEIYKKMIEGFKQVGVKFEDLKE